jgi:hypothetical protein
MAAALVWAALLLLLLRAVAPACAALQASFEPALAAAGRGGTGTRAAAGSGVLEARAVEAAAGAGCGRQQPNATLGRLLSVLGRFAVVDPARCNVTGTVQSADCGRSRRCSGEGGGASW